MTKGTRWAGWRAWRRSRPFWGGLLLVLSGLELLAIPLSGILIHGAVKLVIYIGIGGVFGVLIGILLVVAGIVLWINPGHRVFYGIAGIALGIVSFPASNLGGFFLGMLLAIIGGSIGFAWTPAEAPPVPASSDGAATLGEPTVGLDIFGAASDEGSGAAQPGTAAEAEAEGGTVHGHSIREDSIREGEPASDLSAGGAAR
jgi:Family of unknown function (DUF6114)